MAPPYDPSYPVQQPVDYQAPPVPQPSVQFQSPSGPTPPTRHGKMVAIAVAAIVLVAVLVPVVYFVTLKPKGPVNHPPVANISISASPAYHNIDIALNGSLSTDLDKGDAQKLTYEWAFGDGEAGSGALVNHRYSKDGTYDVALTVSDGKASNTSSKPLIVINGAPIIGSMLPQETAPSVNEGSWMDFKVMATDPNNDILSYVWSVDGKNLSLIKSEFNYTANYSSAGPHVIMIVVSDGSLTDSRTWQVTVGNVNQAPLIKSSYPSISIDMDEGSYQDFLVNATDPDGDHLTYNWALNGTAHGTNLNFYNLSTDYNSSGSYQLTVKVSDGSLSTRHDWNITVHNVNRRPTARAIVDSTIGYLDHNFKFDATGSSDPDMDHLTFQWNFGDLTTGTGQTVNHTFLKKGDFEDRLTVTDPCGGTDIVSMNLTLLPKLSEMSHLFDLRPTTYSFHDLVAADINDDGHNEILGGTNAGLFAYDGSTGADLWSVTTIGWAESIAVANLDSDPQNEIIVGTVTHNIDKPNGTTYLGDIVIIDGKTHTIQGTSKEIGKFTSLSVLDIDSDSSPEIVAGYTTFTSFIFLDNILHQEGGLVVLNSTLSEVFNTTGWGTVTILANRNLDTDPAVELMLSCAKLQHTVGGPNDVNISAYEWASDHPVLKAVLTDPPGSSIAIGDLNGDGSSEVVLGQSIIDPNDHISGNLTIYSGQLMKMAYIPNVGGVRSIAIGELDPSAGNEIVIGSLVTKKDNVYTSKFLVLDKDGNILWGSNISGLLDVVSIGDIDGDSTNEIVVAFSYFVSGTNFNFTISVYSTKARFPLYEITDFTGLGIFLLLDLDKNGRMEVIVSSSTGSIPSTCTVHVYKYP
jgi:hypothetical protein